MLEAFFSSILIYCFRFQSTAAQPAPDAAAATKEKKMSKAVQPSKSFVMNMYLGQAVTEQVFPYPYVLSDEQKETLEMIVDPTEKFFQVKILNEYLLV